MSIVGAFDLHRAQITFDWVDDWTGEARRGRIVPATRAGLREWLAALPAAHGEFAVEGCTGWRFVVEELAAAGFVAHLGDPGEVAALRGSKRRAKTDRADARHLRELLEQRRLPESWIPPAHIVDLRTTVRLRKTLVDERTHWCQRIHAQLFHHGVPVPSHGLRTAATRQHLDQVQLPPAARQLLQVAWSRIDSADAALEPIVAWLHAYARRQPGCRALVDQLYGVGSLVAPTLLGELGDARRFGDGDAVVRYAGLDVTVYSSDRHRSPGHLSRQGPEVLRWALFEAAQHAARPSSPDHELYTSVKARKGATRAALSVARKLARRTRQVLIAIGDDALAPVEDLDMPSAHAA